MDDFDWVGDIPTNDITNGKWVVDMDNYSFLQKNDVQRVLFSKGFSWACGCSIVLKSMSGDDMESYILRDKTIFWGFRVLSVDVDGNGVNYIHGDNVLAMK